MFGPTVCEEFMGNLESGPEENRRLRIGGKEVELVRKLGEGGYSYVFLVQDLYDGTRYALKRILAFDQDSARLATLEIDVMVSEETF